MGTVSEVVESVSHTDISHNCEYINFVAFLPLQRFVLIILFTAAYVWSLFLVIAFSTNHGFA